MTIYFFNDILKIKNSRQILFEFRSIDMQNLKVKFVYRNMELFVKLSILFKKIFRISPGVACFSAVIGFIDVLLGKPDYVRPVCLVIFVVSFLMFLVSFFLEYIFMFLWKCPKCKGKFPWYITTLGYLGEEGGRLINKTAKDICDRSDKKISLIQYENSNLLVPKKCPYCGEVIWKKEKNIH